MSDNNLSPAFSCSAGLDVHQKTVVATILYPKQQVSDSDNDQAEILEVTKTFSTFPNQLEELAKWLVSYKVEIAAMESTGIYWKSVYETLEKYQIKMQVVNARHAKQIPGRKTDVNDSKWLATLARYGLLKSSFIPTPDLRQLRLLTRHRLKIKSMIASEVNCMSDQILTIT